MMNVVAPILGDQEPKVSKQLYFLKNGKIKDVYLSKANSQNFLPSSVLFRCLIEIVVKTFKANLL